MAEVQAEQQLDGRGGLPSIVVLSAVDRGPGGGLRTDQAGPRAGAAAVNAGASGAGKRR